MKTASVFPAVFSPESLAAGQQSIEERSTIHDSNERIRPEVACRAAEFFMRVKKHL